MSLSFLRRLTGTHHATRPQERTAAPQAAPLVSAEALGLRPEQVTVEAVELLAYQADGGLDKGQPDAVVFPQSTEEVARVVRYAARHNLPIVARGAGTGLSGGAVAEQGGVILQFGRMQRVHELSVAGRHVRVEPGVVTQTLDSLAKRHGLYYPPDPSSGRSSTIGGNIAENSGGPHCFKYGVTTNYVSGLEVVLADGQTLQLGGYALDYPAYDFAGVICGSEGTLAVVTAAQLRLVGLPPAVQTLMAAFESVEAAGAAVSALIAQGLMPATLEMMDQRMMEIIEQFAHAGLPVTAGAALIVEADGYNESVGPQTDEIAATLRASGATELRVAQTSGERDAIWYGRKSAVGAMTRLAPAYYLVDVTVPRSKLAPTLAGVNAICAALELVVGYVFHAGDGNLHPLILIPNPRDHELMERVHAAGKQIVELCVSFDGSITGEHGVGIEKRAYMPLMYSPDELQIMRELKEVFDPYQRLNPGKIFPDKLTSWQGDKLAFHEESVPPHKLQTSPDRPITLLPKQANEAAALLREATAAGHTVRIRGGATHSSDLPPTDLVVATSGLCGIKLFARDDMFVTVGAGTPLAALQAELAASGMWVPAVAPDPAATVGGLVASNMNAPLRMRYGGWRDLLLATTAALPDGRVVRLGRPVVKNVAGYDLPKLFVGAHGTLGLLADLTLKVLPLPRARASLVVPIHSVAVGVALGAQLLPRCLVSSALLVCPAPALQELELPTPYALVCTAEGLATDVEVELAQARTVLGVAGQAAMRVDELAGSACWAHWLGTALRAAQGGAGRLIRLGVAPEQVGGLLEALPPDAATLLIDLANGMVYLHEEHDYAALGRAARARGGYGVALAGIRGGARWAYAPPERELMVRLKARWNPGGLLNPGAFIV